MGWRELMVCRILMMIANMIALDVELKKSLHELDVHIRVNCRPEKAV